MATRCASDSCEPIHDSASGDEADEGHQVPAETIGYFIGPSVEGIEQRQDRVYCPGWVGAFRWLKPFLSTRLGEFPVRKAAVEVVAQMDDQVAALGRSTSAYNESVVKRPD